MPDPSTADDLFRRMVDRLVAERTAHLSAEVAAAVADQTEHLELALSVAARRARQHTEDVKAAYRTVEDLRRELEHAKAEILTLETEKVRAGWDDATREKRAAGRDKVAWGVPRAGEGFERGWKGKGEDAA